VTVATGIIAVGAAPCPAEPVRGSLEYWAQRRPGAPGLIDDERRFSYAEWNEAANRIADALAARGLTAGDVIAARMRAGLEWALLATAAGKLGCQMVGVNWRLLPAEVGYVLRDSGATAIVADDEQPAGLLQALADPRLKARVLAGAAHSGYTSFTELLADGARQRWSCGRPPLIIYTSGTTGFPKGVRTGIRSPHFSERELGEYVAAVRSSRLSPGDDGCVLVTMPLHHASGATQVWGALHEGRTVVLMRRFEPERALRLVARHRVTDWNVVPTMLQRIRALPDQVLARQDRTSLRRLTVGGAPISTALKEWALGYFGEDVVAEGYGCTETGMLTNLRPGMQRAKPGSCGYPHRHVSLQVRDAAGRILPSGQPGEIWARTPVTISAYVGQPELPADQLDAQGHFRTGDIGRLDSDGYLYITDRAKDMIVSGGVNIYPAEIERILLQHPAVLEAAVIGLPDPEFGEQVCAFCELRPRAAVDQAELAAFVATRLASYKRPRSIHIVAELPRNTMGKVLKRELRDQSWAGRERVL
jgi:long-chain acyl-CoA synthetase